MATEVTEVTHLQPGAGCVATGAVERVVVVPVHLRHPAGTYEPQASASQLVSQSASESVSGSPQVGQTVIITFEFVPEQLLTQLLLIPAGGCR